MKNFKKIIGSSLALITMVAQTATASGKWDCTECSIDNKRTCLYVVPHQTEGEQVLSKVEQACASSRPVARTIPATAETTGQFYCTHELLSSTRKWSGDSSRCKWATTHFSLATGGCREESFEKTYGYVMRNTLNRKLYGTMETLDACESQVRGMNQRQ